ncbi:MAG: hypothetical protein IPI49_25625 [Myxococcales bacterium]|nr:hypothetical protein [Myxococcales bacterium]
MREEPERQTTDAGAVRAGPASQSAPGKQTAVQARAAEPAPGDAPAGAAGPTGAQRAGDWDMSPELLSAMGLAGHPAAAAISAKGPQAGGPISGLGGADRLRELQAKPPTQVANNISDPPFGWMSAYEVVFTDTEVQLKIKAKLEPQAGVSKDDLLDVGARASDAFRSYYDSKFILTDNANEKQFLLRCAVAFVESGEHYAIKVHPGGSANSSGNRRKWFVGWPGIVCAHELGHQLGLKDEYIDAKAPDRATAKSPGVHTDNSLLGDYVTEGKDKAEVKLRHAQTIAGHIGGASGRAFTVSKK